MMQKRIKCEIKHHFILKDKRKAGLSRYFGIMNNLTSKPMFNPMFNVEEFDTLIYPL